MAKELSIAASDTGDPLRTLRSLLYLCRPRNAVPPVLWLLIGYAACGGSSLRDHTLTAAGLSLIALSFAATLQNDLADREIDRDAKRRSPLLSGKISTKLVRISTYILLAIGILVPLVWGSLILGAYAIICVGLLWSYNQPPLRGSRRPLLSIIVLGLCFGVLPVLMGAQAAANSDVLRIALLALSGFLLRSSVSVLKDYSDFPADKQHRKQTFLVRYGPAAVRRISIFGSMSGALLIGIVLSLTSGVPIVVFAALAGWCFYSYSKRIQLTDDVKLFTRNGQLFNALLLANLLLELGIFVCFYSS